MNHDDGHVANKDVFQYRSTFLELEDQVQNQEEKERHHWDQARVGYQAFPEVAPEQFDQRPLKTAAGAFKTQ